MNEWRALLMVYDRIDVRLPGPLGFVKHFTHELQQSEIDEAVASFCAFPALVSELTHGAAGVRCEIARCDRPLTSLSGLGDKRGWWPSPTDVEPELERFDVEGQFDSVFVFWPQRDWRGDRAIPTGGWGLGMGASPWSLGATYATIVNAESGAWEIPRVGEVWLHEWLHGVCAYFRVQGHEMPNGDADGADRHGYRRSAENGWMGYYEDLMNGNVLENGRRLGIPTAAWRDP